MTTKAEADPGSNPLAGIAQVFSDNLGRGDLLDTQYFFFNLVLLGWFLLTFFVQQADELPDLSDTLGLTSVSALAYVTQKGPEGEGGPTVRSVIPAAAKPGERVKLRGVNFATASQASADALFNGLAGAGPQVTVATTYAAIEVGVPTTDLGIVELRVVAFDGRKSDPIDFEVLAP